MNILQNRLDKINIQNQENKFKHRLNKIIRKGHRVVNSTPFHFRQFIFNGNWHSNIIEQEKFTNYISSYENTYYQILDNLFKKLYYDNYNFFNEFELEENNYSDISHNTQRLKRIIMEVNGIDNIENVPEINELIPVKYLKQKEKRYQGIRLFVNIRETGDIDLYLIDLYHLGIDAYNATTGRYDLERNYNSRRKCNKCISEIVDKYI